MSGVCICPSSTGSLSNSASQLGGSSPDMYLPTNSTSSEQSRRNVVRNLFGTPDARSSSFAKDKIEELIAADSKKWNFDFRNEVPILHGRYKWEPVKVIPQSTNIQGTSTSSTSTRIDSRIPTIFYNSAPSSLYFNRRAEKSNEITNSESLLKISAESPPARLQFVNKNEEVNKNMSQIISASSTSLTPQMNERESPVINSFEDSSSNSSSSTSKSPTISQEEQLVKMSTKVISSSESINFLLPPSISSQQQPNSRILSNKGKRSKDKSNNSQSQLPITSMLSQKKKRTAPATSSSTSAKKAALQ